MKKQHKKPIDTSNAKLPVLLTTFNHALHAGLSALAILTALILPSLVQAGVSLPNGTVNEYVQDMRVQALGGDVVIDRQYYDGRWHVNASWDPVVYSGIPQSTGSCTTYSTIKMREREFTGDGVAWSLDNIYTIRAKDYFAGSECEANRIQTLRWQDRSTGEWMEFERADTSQLQYRLVRYGDRNNNTVTLDYDTESQPDLANLTAGKVKYIRDTNDNILYTYTYTGDQLTQIEDNPSIIAGSTTPARTVQYAYSNTTRAEQTYAVITQVTDVLGNITKYGITNGELTSIEDAQSTPEQPRIRSYKYTAGRITKYTDALGNATTYKYDYDRNKQEFYVRVDSPSGSPGATEHLITENWFDKSGNTIRRDLNGKTSYAKSEEDTVTRSYVETDSAGQRTTTTEDEYGNTIKIEYADGSFASATYSPTHGGMLTRTDELGITIKYDYDANGNLIKITKSLGLPEQRVTEYVVNSLGQTTSTTHKGSTVTLPVLPINGSQTITSPDKTTLYEYDALGNLIKVTDAEGFITQFGFDQYGNSTQVIDANNGAWIAEYDAIGRVLQKTNPLGFGQQLEYDKVGNPIIITDAESNQTHLSYNGNNQLITKQEALGNTRTTEYDGAGRVISVLDAFGNSAVSMQYDARGRLVARINAAGNNIKIYYDDDLDVDNPSSISSGNATRHLSYDNRRRLVEIKDIAENSENSVQEYTRGGDYDKRGRLVKSIDANGNSHQMTYDAMGRLVKILDPLLGSTKLSYDSHDNLIAVTDANNNMTQYQYDNNNRRTKEIRPLGETLTYTYDSVGNFASKTDSTGNITVYTYDTANLRKQEIHTPSATGSMTRTINYTYNKAGTLKSYTDNNTGHAAHQTHSVTYTLDALQRRTAEDITVGNQTIHLATTYDASGSKSSQSLPDTSGSAATVNYTYDVAQQLKDIILPNTGSISVTERLFNQPTNMLYPGGGTNQLSYDGFGRLAETKHKTVNQQTLLQRQYQYDAESNITRIDAEGGNTYQYQYDKLYRLTSADNPTGLQDEQYTYDKLGSRLTDNNKSNPADASGLWQYNGNNQLTQSATVSTATFGSNSETINHQYDVNGNLTSNATPAGTESLYPYSNQTYSYDASNRLTEVKDNQGNMIANYQYDPFGRRIRKTVYRALSEVNVWQQLTTPNTFSYFYADEGLVAEYQTAGQSVATPKLIANYGWEPNGTWGTSPVWISTASANGTANYYYYQNDHLGTPQQLVDSSGSLVWQQKSTAFGEVTLSNIGTGAITSNLRFSGQYSDQETNTSYNFNRQYNPQIGSYTQTDPIGLGGGMSRYGYVGQSPTVEIDPLGLKEFCRPYFPGKLEDDGDPIISDYKTTENFAGFRIKRDVAPVEIGPAGLGWGDAARGTPYESNSPLCPEVSIPDFTVYLVYERSASYHYKQKIKNDTSLLKCYDDGGAQNCKGPSSPYPKKGKAFYGVNEYDTTEKLFDRVEVLAKDIPLDLGFTCTIKFLGGKMFGKVKTGIPSSGL